MAERVQKTEDEWRSELSPEQYRVLREKATEAPWSGALNYVKSDGVYRCAGCGTELFRSDAKFESGSGWPSFFQPVDPNAVGTEEDGSFFMRRTEVHCANCGGHLGHVFEDGPHPTGLRYCINSCALEHEPAAGAEAVSDG
jgi:peptide-methionine (R)-S-oxide reductase